METNLIGMTHRKHLEKTTEHIDTWTVATTEERVWLRVPGVGTKILRPRLARRLSNALARAAAQFGV